MEWAEASGDDAEEGIGAGGGAADRCAGHLNALDALGAGGVVGRAG